MLKLLASVLAWGGACLGIWLLSLTSVSHEELAVGGACALICGMVVTAVMRALRVRWSVRSVPLRPLLRVPLAIVCDAAQVLLRPFLRARAGDVTSRELGATGGSAAAATQRVVAIIAVTSTPGSLVLDVEPKSGRLVLHTLHCAGPRVEEGFQ